MKKRKYLILGLFIFILHGQSPGVETVIKSLLKMENKIYLVPVGEIEEGMLEALEDHLEKTFQCQVERGEDLGLPEEAYNPQRDQYFSSFIMEGLRQSLKAAKPHKILAISDVDLYVEGLNFVFGEAELGGHFCIISLARLRQGFYGFPEDKALFLERAKKEAVHELSHTFRLRHCPDSFCVMHFSNSLSDTDRKRASFCSRCQEQLKKSRVR